MSRIFFLASTSAFISAVSSNNFCSTPAKASDCFAPKSFESALWYDLNKYDQNNPVLVECESRRFGNNLIPDTLFQAMKNGRNILLYDSLENRIRRILKEYTPEKYQKEIISSILQLKAKIAKNEINMLVNQVKTGNFRYTVEQLLINYYDPLYRYPNKPDSDYEFCVDTVNLSEAINAIVEYISNTG